MAYAFARECTPHLRRISGEGFLCEVVLSDPGTRDCARGVLFLE
jgi:hypothetical protein